jgi:ribosomal-protein-alanine N-acetyltransferase
MDLQTERLLIRTLTAEDAPSLAAIWSDPDVTRFMGGPRDYEQTYRDLLSEAAEGNADPADTTYPVIERASGRIVGDCGFLKKEVEGEAETELIYVFAMSAWGKGYATEAARALCTLAARKLRLPRLVALIDPEHAASARVAQKAGMRFWKETIRPTGKRMHVYLRVLNSAV